jgi:ABC-type multidrug transport system fused ATPase/permease subunit
MSVYFNDVRFGQEAIGRDILKGVSFDIPAGEMMALAGHAGAGKRSCASLLLRHWEAEAGTVRIDDADIRDLPPATLRAMITLVPPDGGLGNTCLLDAFRQARPDASAEEIKDAAQQVRVHDVIAALPQGYETPYDIWSERLTAGERQRIAIARILLGKTPIVILHETPARLNADDAQALQAALSQLRRGRTVLLISHRLSTLKLADNIVVLEQGVVVEEGRHAHLVAWNDRYARLLEAQVIRN